MQMAFRRIETEIEIEAPIDRVWALLTDFCPDAFMEPFH